MNGTAAPYRFHAFEISYFSAKVRPALRYKELWYRELRADGREIKRRTGLSFVPIVITPSDETWQDTTEILDRLEERHPDPPLIPQTPLQRTAAHLIELYSDEFALIPAMHYRWGTPEGDAEARARFGAMIGDPHIARAAGDRMAAARIAVGATDETAHVIEDHTQDLLAVLGEHLERHPFLLGDRMSIADCALMGPLYGHLFNDRVPRRLLIDSAPRVVAWIERCNYPDAAAQGAWAADDSLPPTLLPVLRVMGLDAVPVIRDTALQIERWIDDRPPDAEHPPRAMGLVETTLRGIRFTKAVQAYSLWMIHRALDHHAALDDDERRRIGTALVDSEWEELLALELRHRIVKRGFDLAFADGDEHASSR